MSPPIPPRVWGNLGARGRCGPGCKGLGRKGEHGHIAKFMGCFSSRREAGAGQRRQEEIALGFSAIPGREQNPPGVMGEKRKERGKYKRRRRGGEAARSMQRFPLPPPRLIPRKRGILLSSFPSHPPRPKPFQLELPFVVQRALPLISHLALVCVAAAGGRQGGKGGRERSRKSFFVLRTVRTELGVFFLGGGGILPPSPGESGFGSGVEPRRRGRAVGWG